MMNTLYVHRPLLNASALARYASAVGLRNVLLPVDMHVTIAYSKDAVDWTKGAFLPDLTTILSEGGMRKISRFGDSVVLQFEDRLISQRWAQFIMAGASWDFPEYLPHVTLAIDSQSMVDGITAPTIGLRFGPEKRAPLDPDWEAKTS